MQNAQAYQEGINAKKSGIHSTENPFCYTKQYRQWSAWLQGWHSAE